MAQYIEKFLAISREAAGSITASRFVKPDATDPRKVVQAGAGDATLGVATPDQAATYSTGDTVPVAIDGVVLVEAGGAISVNGEVESDANGRAVARTTGSRLGRALEAAAAAGELVPVLLFENQN